MKLYVFDLDGVITDPTTKTVQHPQLFEYFVKILEKGDLLTFNTGRPELINGIKPDFPLQYTHQLYSAGTVEYLSAYSSL